jgi:hypothetical protein
VEKKYEQPVCEKTYAIKIPPAPSEKEGIKNVTTQVHRGKGTQAQL